MVEPEMAFCDLRGDMATAEAFIRDIIASVLNRCEDDIAFFNQWVEKGLIAKLTTIVNSPFEVMTYTDAVAALEKAPKTFKFKVAWGTDLQSEHERYLTEELVRKPLFLIDYPRDIKAFYMRVNDDGRTVAAMDLLVPGVGEIIGGSQREDDLDFLLERMAEENLPAEPYEWYLDLRRYGSVPHGGFGLGVERTLAWICGLRHIREAIPFPRLMGRIYP